MLFLKKEALAVFWEVQKFYKYLFGSKLKIQTDCAVLTILNGKPAKNARILRWQVYLQNLDYTNTNNYINVRSKADK